MKRSVLSWIFAASVGTLSGGLAVQASSCALSADAAGSGGGFASTGTGHYASGAGGDASVKPDGQDPPPKLKYTALCGAGRCVPGGPNLGECDVGSSSTAATSSVSTGTGAGGSGSSSAGGGGNGSGGASSTGTVGATSAVGTGTGSAGGGVSLGCQITSDGSHPSSVCAPVGSVPAGQVCTGDSDCAVGLGCVFTPSSPDVGTCQEYCCGDIEHDCPDDPPSPTYCTPRPMAENASRKIPVCIVATPCTVFDDTPCVPTDQYCSVVRTTGLTSCVDKGTGGQCDPCPCAAGFMCSTTGSCLKLCHTSGSAGDECNGGTCQGGVMNLPTGVGQCVGALNDCNNQ